MRRCYEHEHKTYGWLQDSRRDPDGTVHEVRCSDGYTATARCRCGWNTSGHWYDIRRNGWEHLGFADTVAALDAFA